MVGIHDGRTGSVPIEDVAQSEKPVPLDHPWLVSAAILAQFLAIERISRTDCE